MDLTVFKVVNIKSIRFNIYKNNKNVILFDLIAFSIIHKYNSPKYLVNYYGNGINRITIYDNKYTDWNGMVTLCCRARKYGVRESFQILQNIIFTDSIELNETPENSIIKEIKEYFGKVYKYKDQYNIGKYYIDLLIQNEFGTDLVVEIDEKYHNTEAQKVKDQIREYEIKRIYNCNFIRIKCSSSSDKKYLNKIRKLLN